MAIPQTKAALSEVIITNYGKLRAVLQTIPPQLCSAPELEGHAKQTLMSINNLLAYLLGWGQLVLKWNHKKAKGEKVDFPETGFKWNELGLLAQKFYKDYENDTFECLIEKLDQTVNEVLLWIDGQTDYTLYGQAWYQKWTMGRMIQFNTSSPYQNAKNRISKWKKFKQIK